MQYLILVFMLIYRKRIETLLQSLVPRILLMSSLLILFLDQKYLLELFIMVYSVFIITAEYHSICICYRTSLVITKTAWIFLCPHWHCSKKNISDLDMKLIGGKAHEYLNGLVVHANVAPSYHQDKNGLAECHWQTIVCMARNWSASAELPSTFWFYAACCTVEVCNYR